MNCIFSKKRAKWKWVFTILILQLFSLSTNAQDSCIYRLNLSLSLIDAPQNINLPYRLPSMKQSMEVANDLYDISYLGIDVLGDKLFRKKDKAYTGVRKFSNHLFKYVLGLGFSQYGSELPVPLGVWAHEEFHRSVLGLAGIHSKNGNWFLNRWDGSVYGISDENLSNLKANHNDQLLYSYVAGIHSEIQFNQVITLNDFYKKKSLYKNSFLLYNAYYVYNYFKFSTGPLSDSVKVLAPPHEDKDPRERDYAGADLNAWVFDMFNPDSAFTSRTKFPGGDGVNKRIGFSELSGGAKDFLNKQTNLSLINFINPAIFFVNGIRINKNFSFLFFAQYAPTHFGNEIGYFLPVQYKQYDLLGGFHSYHNGYETGHGFELALYNYKINRLLEADLTAQAWQQPDFYFSHSQSIGGAGSLKLKLLLTKGFSFFAEIRAKSRGWQLGNPYLKENMSFQCGLRYRLIRPWTFS